MSEKSNSHVHCRPSANPACCGGTGFMKDAAVNAGHTDGRAGDPAGRKPVSTFQVEEPPPSTHRPNRLAKTSDRSAQLTLKALDAKGLIALSNLTLMLETARVYP
ncbi:hypothetical protein AAFF_G00305700 [Aldrovandia affinis]|uniref:Uncharacterized protein n=1 Tax=Aldrovandia affinis TaxID=143900 RepID=A0AAD7SPG3_9TELE|nr:hypothetical protein AAFF_G00305700 [Aldrovandia affinis]